MIARCVVQRDRCAGAAALRLGAQSHADGQHVRLCVVLCLQLCAHRVGVQSHPQQHGARAARDDLPPACADTSGQHGRVSGHVRLRDKSVDVCRHQRRRDRGWIGVRRRQRPQRAIE
jgi:hypothetical protein